MMHKQHTITMPKSWLQAGSFGLHLHEIIAKFGQSFEIPTGYQDENGFHFGAEPSKKGAKSSSAR